MRTVIVENVETAEAKKQRLATTAVDAALEILRTEASGLVIEAAAPLVFQGLCRRDNIRVEFTQTPMTNGRVIWLGPIDLGHKLASIYVYGHGCHERLRGHPRGPARCCGLRRLPALATRALQGARGDGDGRLEQSERP